ncbi:hypothetical protein POSPLADRAFT_1044153 [Postia placenta MAD-698-R-SB12]|uniref:Mitochondrial escape protein 2 n=1 Tax=Postia placenta MAD-698-R-SB12 TaxID=670580 RepID=A0A1X6N8F6_9APHY|nr:hypothetical protein POSPLADRAFT_1044153 [Postia placenta MAD-698-R-SB12]OSX64663.1 hypothetical protein POSPLADRAFT_1044153 [Postia placenta MAD-698-R-SB12]
MARGHIQPVIRAAMLVPAVRIQSVRRYIGYFREEVLLDRLRSVLADVKVHGFKVLNLEPHPKDGGVFVRFRCNASSNDAALSEVVHSLRQYTAEHGGVPSWAGLSGGNVWLVKGKPWREDMNRYASPILRVAFEGPDVPEESLYDLLRPYGRIQDLSHPMPPPAVGGLRYSIVTFRGVRSAAIARNAVHGARVAPSGTIIHTTYQAPVQAHAVRDYMASHPRIFLPVLVFLLGTITYTIFDPVRVFMVEGKIEGWFNIREFQLYKWLRNTALDKLSFSSSSHVDDTTTVAAEDGWKERKDAENALDSYLNDLPNTIAFVHGPQGSGKSRMIASALKETGRKALIIDVAELSKASSDTTLVSALAQQTGYWPVFSVFNSLNNLIDLASVGLIGQKAGLSSSLTDQLKQILEVVGTGLARVNTTHRQQHQAAKEDARLAVLQREAQERLQERIRTGRWHDGRLDCIAGNGVMSELGIGDELFGDDDADPTPMVSTAVQLSEKGKAASEKLPGPRGDEERRQTSSDDVPTIKSMPIVIVKGFETKGGGQNKQEMLDVIAHWVATLAQNQVAHVVVVSDNRENTKRLAKALPSQPLNLITLSDADNASALSFVKQKLHDAGVDVRFNSEQRTYIQRLGGRASDLESLIHKVRSGQTVQEAVEDIITRGVGEIRKNAFGDDLEDAKNLPWSREQAWALMQKLSTKSEISYNEVLLDFPFKNDEASLRHMEHAELIAIGTENGRSSSIKPGKPIYKYVFERLVQDHIFRATQDIAFNEKVIAASESTVKACEQELLALKDVDAGTADWWGSRTAVRERMNYLLKKMRLAEEKIEALDKQNTSLKKILSK